MCESMPLPAPVLGTIEDFADLAADVEIAILTSRKHLPIANAVSDRLPPTQLILVDDAQDIQTLWLRVRTLGNAVGIQFEWDPFLRHNRLLKRVMDLCIAVPAAILFAPMVAVLALLIMAVDCGSPFYVQPRVGLRGRQIKIPKLRTMFRDAAAPARGASGARSAGARGMGALFQALQRSAHPARGRQFHPPGQPG